MTASHGCHRGGLDCEGFDELQLGGKIGRFSHVRNVPGSASRIRAPAALVRGNGVWGPSRKFRVDEQDREQQECLTAADSRR